LRRVIGIEIPDISIVVVVREPESGLIKFQPRGENLLTPQLVELSADAALMRDNLG
jgi:hypothetical protein